MVLRIIVILFSYVIILSEISLAKDVVSVINKVINDNHLLDKKNVIGFVYLIDYRKCIGCDATAINTTIMNASSQKTKHIVIICNSEPEYSNEFMGIFNADTTICVGYGLEEFSLELDSVPYLIVFDEERNVVFTENNIRIHDENINRYFNDFSGSKNEKCKLNTDESIVLDDSQDRIVNPVIVRMDTIKNRLFLYDNIKKCIFQYDLNSGINTAKIIDDSLTKYFYVKQISDIEKEYLQKMKYSLSNTVNFALSKNGDKIYQLLKVLEKIKVSKVLKENGEIDTINLEIFPGKLLKEINNDGSYSLYPIHISKIAPVGNFLIPFDSLLLTNFYSPDLADTKYDDLCFQLISLSKGQIESIVSKSLVKDYSDKTGFNFSGWLTNTIGNEFYFCSQKSQDFFSFRIINKTIVDIELIKPEYALKSLFDSLRILQKDTSKIKNKNSYLNLYTVNSIVPYNNGIIIQMMRKKKSVDDFILQIYSNDRFLTEKKFQFNKMDDIQYFDLIETFQNQLLFLIKCKDNKWRVYKMNISNIY